VFCSNQQHGLGIGPKRALELIKKWGSLEKIVANLDKEKYKLPEIFPIEEVRQLFLKPDVTPADQVDVRAIR